MKYGVPGAIALLVILVAGCTPPPQPPTTPAFVGAWVNPAWNGRGADPPAKIVFEEGRAAFYENDTDETPHTAGTFDLEQTGIGGRTFKGVISIEGFAMYSLLRVSNHDATLEADFLNVGYPERIDPMNNNFSCFTRQGTMPPEVGWIFYGTWVNPAFNGGHGTSGPPGKFKMSADSFASYDNDGDGDGAPMSTGTLSVREEWTSTGYHFFTGDMTITAGTGAGSHAFFLMRVSNSNGTLEMGTSDTDYPTTVGITYDRR